MAIPWQQAGTHLGAVCGHLRARTPALAVVARALVSARGWQRLLGPASVPPTRTWCGRGRQEFPSTAPLLHSPRPPDLLPHPRAGWAQGVPHQGRVLLALHVVQLVLGWRVLEKRQARCWQRAAMLHPLHCPCSRAWGLRWVFKTWVSAREREEGSQPFQEWLQRDRGETFPAEPQLQARGGQEAASPPYPMPPAVPPHPKGMGQTSRLLPQPFSQALGHREGCGGTGWKGKELPPLLAGKRETIPQPLPSQFGG